MKQRAQFYAVAGFVIGVVVIFWLGFSAARHSSGATGFRLPEGNPADGAVAFVELGCSNCHSVYGVPDFDRPSEYQDLLVPLGGEVRVVKSYGELVTAIIHPSESIRADIGKKYVDINGDSLMPDLTKVMTTREMIDLVTYLQEHYELLLPDYPANYYPYSGFVSP